VESSQRIAVIGGGASGIAAAHFLLGKKHRVVLFEKQSSLGGRIATAELGARRVAIGGKNFGREAVLFRQFVADNGNARFEEHGVNISREVGGRLLPMKPRNLWEALRNMQTMGLRDTLKFMKYFQLIRNANGANDYLGNETFVRISEENDHKPLSEHFGARFNEHFLRLLTVRGNGAEPDACYLGNICANLGAGSPKGLEQLEGDGMFSTLQAFVRHPGLQSVGDAEVSAVAREAAGYRIVVAGRTDLALEPFDAVVVALPAQCAAALLDPLCPGIAAALNKITYNPTAMAVVQYDVPVFNEKVMALSFGKNEILSSAGAYGNNDLDIVRYTFSGGAASRSVNANSDPEQLLRTAEDLLARYCPKVKGNRRGYVYRYFAEGHCAYAPYHHRVMQTVEQKLSGLAVEVTGDYVKGASVEACFMASRCAVDAVLAKLAAAPVAHRAKEAA
jgi:protoporphyrinogen/coproporphyrinogen III oxidase